MLQGFRLILLSLLLWSGWAPVSVSAQTTQIESLTIEQGLSQGMIFSLLQTRDGFLWVGTKEGLNRYDGYNFTVYSNDPLNPYSLGENTVTTLFEDSRGWLWIGTESKGLDLFDRRNGRFYHLELNVSESNTQSLFEIVQIQEARDGSIWVLQRPGNLTQISVPAQWTQQMPQQANLDGLVQVRTFAIADKFISKQSFPNGPIGFSIRKNGSLEVLTNYQQVEVDPVSGNIRSIAGSPFPTYLENAVFLDGAAEGDFWAVNKTNLYRRRGQVLETIPLPGKEPVDRIFVRRTPDGQVWLTIDRKVWKIPDGKALDFAKPDWEMDQKPTVLTTDRNGNIWVGTIGYGLRKINPRKKLFHAGGAGTTVWGLWRDIHGRYYCKVFNKIYPYDPASGKVSPQLAFPDAPPRQLDMAWEPSGAFWVLCRGDAEDGRAVLRRHTQDGTLSQSVDFAFNPYAYARIQFTREGQLWALGTNCQLVRFDPGSKRFEYFSYAHLFGESANTTKAFAVAEDWSGNIWIGTQRGLVKGTRKGQTFDFQLFQANAKTLLSSNSISCLLLDPSETQPGLWIGTKGGGINYLDLRSELFQQFNTKHGLPNDVIYGILPGTPHPTTGYTNLWCSTNRGLTRLSPKSTFPLDFNILTFTAAKGLQDNEFNTQAYSKAANGELLFGGVNGLNHFLPQELVLDSVPPPVYVVGLEINHRPVLFGQPNSPMTAPLEWLRELRLAYDQNNISFEFSALDFTDPAQNRYRYQLEGLDKQWVETGAKHVAHFTHLAPGRYQFRVQGSNGEGNWQEAPNPIVLIIQPPWWRSKLAYLLYGALILGAVWQGYQFQIRRVQLREQLAFEHRETNRIRALEEMKSNFFSNVTHEFRTPLTLMLEPLRQVLKNPQDPLLTEKLSLVERNSQQLLRLVNQLLDMAKVESGSMGLDLQLGDPGQLLRSIHHAFLPLATERGIRFSLELPNEIPPLVFDANKTELILNNLISNALKFTPTDGSVTVRCQTALAGRSSPVLLFTVSDTGTGILPENLTKIFDRFYQVEGTLGRSHEGTGIGLALSKELAELMNGHLRVRSAVGQGSEFTLWLPVRHEPAAEVPETKYPATSAAAPQETKQPELNSSGLPVALVIEDNVDLRGFIVQSIAGHWQVLEAADGEEGIQKAVEALPDLVLSDVMMPGKDGYELCHVLKNMELTAHIPVILLTAKSGMDAKLKGLRIGADDYLTKPFHTEELLARMDNLIELRRKLRLRYGQQQNEPASPEAGEFLSPPDKEFLRRLNDILEQNLSDETLGVEEFAQKMFISRVQLHRKLKALTDQSPTEFIRDYRLDRAMEMLKKREGLVSEIAASVGFSNEKYFSTVFKEKFGLPPSKV